MLDAIGIIVADLPTSIALYQKLGLDFGPIAPDEDHVEAKTASGLRVMLDSRDLVSKFIEGWQPRVGNTQSLAFLMPSPEAVDQKAEELVAAGATLAMAPWDAFWGQRYACLRDPDGHGIDLFAPLG